MASGNWLGIGVLLTCGLVLLGVLLAIKTVTTMATFAAALIRNPAATSWVDFFKAAGWIFCLPLRAAVPDSVPGFTVDYASHAY